MNSDTLYDMFSGMSEAEIAEQLTPIITGIYIFSIVAQVLMLIISGVIAHKKGRSVVGCVILTWFFGLIGLIITACMRSKKTAPASRTSSGGSYSHSSSSASSTPSPTFGRGSSGSSGASTHSGSNGFTSAIGSSGSSGKKSFGIKMCPHCGSAVSSRHCAMCGKDNNLF